jgi:hypothetical protein
MDVRADDDKEGEVGGGNDAHKRIQHRGATVRDRRRYGGVGTSGRRGTMDLARVKVGRIRPKGWCGCYI